MFAGRVTGATGNGMSRSAHRKAEPNGGWSSDVGRTHIDLGTERQLRRSPRIVEGETDPLTLAQHAKDRAGQCVAGEVVLAHIGVADDDAVTCARVVRLDHTLHVRRTRSSVGYLLDLAGLDATGAGIESPRCTTEGSSYALDVRVPTALGLPVGVADRVAEAWFFATDFADRCHWCPYERCGEARVRGGYKGERVIPKPDAQCQGEAT